LHKSSATQPDDYRHPATFQVAVALAAIEARESETEIAHRYGVTLEQVLQWKKTLIEDAVNIFKEKHTPSESGKEISHNELALTIAENSTQGFAMMDERGYCIYANTAWLQMTGYTLVEIGSRPLHELVHHHYPDGRPYPLSECPIDRALPHNFKVRAHEDLFFRKDGTAFSVMCAASPIFKNGRPVATVIEIRDITHQKQIDGELQRVSQRQAFLLRLAETLRALEKPAEVMVAASRLIGEYFKVGRVGYGDIDDAEETVSIDGDWTDGGMPSLVGESLPLNSFGPAVVDEVRSGETLRLNDIAADPRSAPYAAGYASIGVRSTIAVPLLEEARLTAVLFLHESSPRNWSDEEIALVEDVARRTWEAVKRARRRKAT
jgi:PAS domain S-box-containing protein